MKTIDQILAMPLRDALTYIKGAYCFRTKFVCKKPGREHECPFFVPVKGARWLNNMYVRGGISGHSYTDDIHICAWYRFGKVLQELSGRDLTKIKNDPGDFVSEGKVLNL